VKGTSAKQKVSLKLEEERNLRETRILYNSKKGKGVQRLGSARKKGGDFPAPVQIKFTSASARVLYKESKEEFETEKEAKQRRQIS